MVLKYELADHVATVTLDRPETKNALNRELYARLEQALADAHRDPEVRCVIVTGAGTAFCSGDDVRPARTRPPPASASRCRAQRPLPWRC